MSAGTIITKKLKSGKLAYLLKYDAGPDPSTGERCLHFRCNLERVCPYA